MTLAPSARRVSLTLFLIAFAPAVTAAHVGSPDVIFDGKAGAYDLRVTVRPPMVVPGLAEVTVRVLHGDAHRVLIRPVFWRAGVTGSPSPDPASPVAGMPNTYSGQLWLMARGAYSVYVTVEGTQGNATVGVPVMSVATARLPMQKRLGVLLAALGSLLIAGLITIAHAASGESLVEPGRMVDRGRRRRARIIAVAAAPLLALIVLGGAKWWQSVDGDYQLRMYRPRAASVSVTHEGAVPRLHLAMLDSAGRPLPLDPLMPDHGKVMHLFVIDSAHGDAFAHLHPLYDGESSFSTPIPPLPSGRYRLFADITQETGQTHTITGWAGLTSDDSSLAARATRRDPDDAWLVATRVKRHIDGITVDTLEDGSTMEWLPDSVPLHAGQDATLRFRVRAPDGSLATLEPYLGMSAHAVVMQLDGSLFIHIHPAGTISVAAQQAFALRDRGDTTKFGRLRLGTDTMNAQMSFDGEIAFPYMFPRAGAYRVWVQVRRAGRVLTGVFDTPV